MVNSVIKIESLLSAINNALNNDATNEYMRKELLELYESANKLKNQYFSMKKYIDSILGEDGATRYYDGGNLDLLYQRVQFNYGRTNSDKVKAQLESVYKPLCNARTEVVEINSRINEILRGGVNTNKNNYYMNGNNINYSINNEDKKNEKLINYNERTVGFTVINIIGLILVILGLSILGKYVYSDYFTNLAKGIFLYVIAIIVLLVSELFIRRKNKKFSQGITALGIAILYMSTFINKLYLRNFDTIIAIAICIIISVISIVFSYYRESLSVRLISLLGAYISIIPSIPIFIHRYSMEESILIGAFYLIINITNLMLPLRYKKENIDVFVGCTIVINGIFLLILGQVIQLIPYEGILIFNLLIILYMNKILLKNEKNYFLDVYVYVIAVLFLSFHMSLIMGIIFLVISMGSVILYKNSIKLNSYLSGMIVAISFIESNFQLVTIRLLLASLFLGIAVWYWIKVRKGIVQSVVYIFIAYLLSLYTNNSIINSTIVFVAISAVALIYSTFRESSHYVALKEIAIFEGVMYAMNIANYLGIYKAELFFALIFLVGEMLLFTFVESLRSKSYKIDNIIYLCIMLVTSLSQLFGRNFYNVGFLFVVIIAMYIFFREEYIPFNISRRASYVTNSIIGIIFVLSMPRIIGVTLVNSIIMIIAIVSILKGFKEKDKVLRVLGLSVAIFIAIKVFFHDLIRMSTLGKSIVCISVGALILVISFIYSLRKE